MGCHRMSRPTKIQKQLRDQFIDFTHTTSAIAERFLKSSNYDLELAINNYLSYQGSSNKKDSKNLSAIFDRYKEKGQSYIGIDGTIKYIEDLGYEPEDKVILALAEFLESPSAGVFNRTSFILKWQSIQVETLQDMRKHLQLLEKKLETDSTYLKSIYQFTFKFLLEEGQRTLPLETAVEHWFLLLKPIYGDKVDIWVEFLNQEWKRAISRDAWNMYFVFLQEFDKDPKLENYDETASWPSLLDSFVEWFKEQS